MGSCGGSSWVLPAFSARENVLGQVHTPDRKTVYQGCVLTAGEHLPRLQLCDKQRKKEAELLHFPPPGLRMSSEGSLQIQVLGLWRVWISLRNGHFSDVGAGMCIYISCCL